MTHYYLYIKAGLEIDRNTTFYKVGVGESEAQRKKLAWLQAFANEHGHFFLRWSLDAVEFMIKCQDSIGVEHHQVLAVMACDLVRILRTGCEEPSSYQAELNRHRLLMQIDPNYYFCHTIRSLTKYKFYGKS